MALSIIKMFKDMANAIKGLPKIQPLSGAKDFTSQTTLTDTKAVIKIPANSYVCLTAAAVYAKSKPALIQISKSDDDDVFSESPVARNNAATTLSFYAEQACSVIVKAQYSSSAANFVRWFGFIITFGGGYGVACILRRWHYAVSEKVFKGCYRVCNQYKNYIVPKTEQTVDVCRRDYRNAQVQCKQIQRAFSNSRFWRGIHTDVNSGRHSIPVCGKNAFLRNLPRGSNLCECKQNVYRYVETAEELHCNHISLRQINSERRRCCV